MLAPCSCRAARLLACCVWASASRRSAGSRASTGAEELSTEWDFNLAESEGGDDANASRPLEELMAEFFPQLPPLIEASSTRSTCTRDGGRSVRAQTGGKDGWKMKLLWPGCFEKMRGALGSSWGFAQSVGDFHGIGSGSGISGAQHFLTNDGRFYMKSIPAKEAKLLENSDYIVDLTEYTVANPSTLMVQMLAVLKFFSGYQKMWLLVMDNYKRFVNRATDSFVEFDLKGSKWKHRIKSDGGRRCSPTFPLGFWKAGADKPHRFEGEDLDFYGLRTQASAQWFQQVDSEMLAATPGSFRRRALESDVKKMPIHDECLGGGNALTWLQAQASKGSSVDFCGALGNESSALLALLEQQGGDLRQYTRDDARRLRDAFQRAAAPCQAFVGNAMSDGQAAVWRAFVKQEKVAIESVRDYFGYAAPSGELTQKPLVVEPCMREALLSQLEKDTNFLSSHGIMDYSMGLLIKHHEADPKSSCKVDETAAPSWLFANSGGGFHSKSVFERYHGGMRAVGARPTDQPEQAVFTFKIVDTLTQWSFAKFGSGLFQGLVADNKVESQLPEAWEELVTHLTQMGVTKCKNTDPDTSEWCWSSCGSSPTCSVGDLEWSALAEYNFHGDWVNDNNDNLACMGLWNSGRRALCAKGARELTLPAAKMRRTPEPFKSAMVGTEIEEVLRGVGVQKVLSETLEFKVYPAAPIALKRIAAMAYYDFARRPFQEDTVPAGEYAERFRRFFSAWTGAPHAEAWREMCPEAAEAGCGHAGAAASHASPSAS